jgi:hypothetical protein
MAPSPLPLQAVSGILLSLTVDPVAGGTDGAWDAFELAAANSALVNPHPGDLLFSTLPAFVPASGPSPGARAAAVRSVLRNCVDWAVVRRLLSLSEHDPVDVDTRLAAL